MENRQLIEEMGKIYAEEAATMVIGTAVMALIFLPPLIELSVEQNDPFNTAGSLLIIAFSSCVGAIAGYRQETRSRLFKLFRAYGYR